MRKYYKIFIIIFVLFISITSVKIKAAIGYTYSHSGEPIYSTVGLSVTMDGIYTVISENWTNPLGEALKAEDFTSPEDLFVYNDLIYIVDSKSNNLFVFDEDMNYKFKVDKFEIRPEDFTDEEIIKVNTRNDEESVKTSVKFTTKNDINLLEFRQIANIQYENRTEDQKFYLDCFGLTGVYRAFRPARDDNGVNIPGEFDDLIYLADKYNNQIVIVDANDFHVVQVVSAPTDVSFKGKVFFPVKLVTDFVGRMFVISEGVYEGIMHMSYDGEFSSFVGVNKVTLSFWEALKRRLMTEEQLSQQALILNTTFTSIAVDSNRFIYATSNAVNGDDSSMIKKFNPWGKDVLTKNGYADPKGDLVYIRTGIDNSLISGPSEFTSITVNDYGVYTVADGKTGRLFTYDDEGNLLYISAGKGNELDTLTNPVAIRYQGENILALDKKSKAVLRYIPTDIAVAINKAVKYHYEGDLQTSSLEWKNVVEMNPNYEFAYVGIGKTLLKEGKYKEAMSYFQTGYNVNYYSQAYKLYRDEQIKKYFEPTMFVVLILSIGLISYKGYKKYRNRGQEETGIGDE